MWNEGIHQWHMSRKCDIVLCRANQQEMTEEQFLDVRIYNTESTPPLSPSLFHPPKLSPSPPSSLYNTFWGAATVSQPHPPPQPLEETLHTHTHTHTIIHIHTHTHTHSHTHTHTHSHIHTHSHSHTLTHTHSLTHTHTHTHSHSHTLTHTHSLTHIPVWVVLLPVVWTIVYRALAVPGEKHRHYTHGKSCTPYMHRPRVCSSTAHEINTDRNVYTLWGPCPYMSMWYTQLHYTVLWLY